MTLNLEVDFGECSTTTETLPSCSCFRVRAETRKSFGRDVLWKFLLFTTIN